MSFLEKAEHFAESGWGKLTALTDTIGDYTTLGYDQQMGVDPETSNKHAIDLAIDQQKLVSPEPISEGLDIAEHGKGLSDKDEANDKHAEYAKKGALAGLPLMIVNPLAPIIGSIIGGGIGALKEPKAGHVFDGSKIGAGLGATALNAANNTPFGPPTPTPKDHMTDYLASHPFGHYAL
jgi:hypothetical protein